MGVKGLATGPWRSGERLEIDAHCAGALFDEVALTESIRCWLRVVFAADALLEGARAVIMATESALDVGPSLTLSLAISEILFAQIFGKQFLSAKVSLFEDQNLFNIYSRGSHLAIVVGTVGTVKHKRSFFTKRRFGDRMVRLPVDQRATGNVEPWFRNDTQDQQQRI